MKATEVEVVSRAEEDEAAGIEAPAMEVLALTGQTAVGKGKRSAAEQQRASGLTTYGLNSPIVARSVLPLFQPSPCVPRVGEAEIFSPSCLTTLYCCSCSAPPPRTPPAIPAPRRRPRPPVSTLPPCVTAGVVCCRHRRGVFAPPVFCALVASVAPVFAVGISLHRRQRCACAFPAFSFLFEHVFIDHPAHRASILGGGGAFATTLLASFLCCLDAASACANISMSSVSSSIAVSLPSYGLYAEARFLSQSYRNFARKSSYKYLRIRAVQGNDGRRRLVDIIRIIPELSRDYFRSRSRRALFGGISLLGGFYVAQTISLSFGALGVNDVLAAVVCVLLTEYVTKFYYSRPKVTFPIALLNNFKMGFTYGLFIDAFKLAS